MSKFKVGQRVRLAKIEGNLAASVGAEAIVTEIGEWLHVKWDRTSGLAKSQHDGGYHEHWFDPVEPATTIHYTPDSTGKDYLARCEDTFSREEMIGAYRFTLGKYVDRMGKKTGEPVEKELAKIIDYATRAKAWLGGGE